MKSKNYAVFAIIIAALLFSNSVSAQLTGSGYDSAEDSMIEIFNQVLLTYEAQSIADVFLFFILPLLGFYFINMNIFQVAFESFEERISRDDYPNRNDEIPTGLRGLAFVVAFMTVQVAGGIGPIVLLGLAILAYAAWILNYVGLFDDWTRNGESQEEILEEAEQDEAAAEEDLEDAEDEERNARNNENQTEAREAQRRILNALAKIDEAEEDLEYIIELDLEELQKNIEKAKEAHQEDEIGMKSVRDFKKRAEAIREVLANLVSYHNENSFDLDINTNLDPDDEAWKFVSRQFRELEDDLNYFKKQESNSGGQRKKAFDKILEVFKRYQRVKELVDNLPGEIEEAREAENFEQKLSSHFGDEDLSDLVNVGEDRINELGAKLNELKEEQRMEQDTIKRARDYIGNELEMFEDIELELEDLITQVLPDIRNQIDDLEPQIGDEDKKNLLDKWRNEVDNLKAKAQVILNNVEKEEGWLSRLIP